eukprot:CAMPEP_0197655040 /NCGR_PEP_ID=MMETSP1338-20131121/39215_1 /TAXON_ID=43686 ORGANISM="Pelagodinium beii, Strain RCC1491" /NCGR_SAMPLE_ID=MMETSP1338 /ASSEMBLY_ACC=CAM_ASM_000754 /LENGTH=54 /DNA_ID=CAMNT_0043230609 /DNA_START=16 /DNA_END=180 /DNA_ORIENTATION=+
MMPLSIGSSSKIKSNADPGCLIEPSRPTGPSGEGSASMVDLSRHGGPSRTDKRE